jgi:hypothetical protein
MEELIIRHSNVFSNDEEYIELGDLLCHLELKKSTSLNKIKDYIKNKYNERKEYLSKQIENWILAY